MHRLGSLDQRSSSTERETSSFKHIVNIGRWTCRHLFSRATEPPTGHCSAKGRLSRHRSIQLRTLRVTLDHPVVSRGQPKLEGVHCGQLLANPVRTNTVTCSASYGYLEGAHALKNGSLGLVWTYGSVESRELESQRKVVHTQRSLEKYPKNETKEIFQPAWKLVQQKQRWDIFLQNSFL